MDVDNVVFGASVNGGNSYRGGESAEWRGEHATFGRIDDRALLKEFRSYLVDELHKSAATARTYCACLRILTTYADTNLMKLDSKDVRNFLRSDYEAKTKQVTVTAAKSFHLWGVLDGRWKQNGMVALKAPKQKAERKEPLEDHLARRLLESCERASETRIVWLGLYGGLRISESASIDKDNWQRDRLSFVGKGSKPRVVPVHPALEERRELILSRSLSPGGAHSALARFRERTGFTGTAHDFRRTFGSHLYEKAGAPWEVVAKVLGHGQDVTALYARISFPRMKDYVEKVDYWGGEPIQLSLF